MNIHAKPGTTVRALAILLLLPPAVTAQISFTDGSSRMVNPSLRSGVAVAISDMNSDGLDDLVRLGNANMLEIEYQTAGGGTYTRHVHGAMSGTAWGMCIADVDRNGFNDIFNGGAYNGLKLLKADAMGTSYALTMLPPPSIFVQATSFADIDNDGDADMLICHDDGISSPYRNDGAGNMTYDLTLINAATTIPSDNSGNYGIVWTDYDSDGAVDVYISKCRLGVGSPTDGRRINLLFENDGMGNYADVALAAGLRAHGQSWASDFADIDNDGDMDCFVINHEILSVLFENNGNVFSDITAAAGLTAAATAMAGDGIQCRFSDFDNDGFVDLLITGNGGEDRLMRNNGNRSFTRVTNPYPSSPRYIHTPSVGDLNTDGFPDILAVYATGYASPGSTGDKILLNSGNANHWISARLTGTTSNINALGARVEIHGAWGTQVREVRGGEGYGIQHSFLIQFGIGAETQITDMVVRWPSGTLTTIPSPSIDTFHDIVEGQLQCSGVCGDCDGDASPPTTLDAFMAARIAVRIVTPTSEQLGCCDINSDLVINVIDAFQMAKTAAGLPTVLTCQ